MKPTTLCTGKEPLLGMPCRNFLQRFGGGLGGWPWPTCSMPNPEKDCTIQPRPT